MVVVEYVIIKKILNNMLNILNLCLVIDTSCVSKKKIMFLKNKRWLL